MLKALRFPLVHFEELVAGVLFVLMSLATLANVIGRYFFNAPIEWAEEFSRYAFIWVVFLGAAYCSKANRHIVIDSIVLALPVRVRAFLQVFVDLLIMVLMGTLLYYGWALTVFTTQPTSTLYVPMSVVYVVVPISALAVLIRSIGTLAGHLRRAAAGRETAA
ncbi:MAG TPA: TRAP transporter small permease [Thermodesulfobacteriota bacterium]|nr:TRAP transporter small permease [Thermodesulfobacteriota bacterium]